MLRRPFSLAGRRDMPAGQVALEIIYRTIGAGTHWLSRAPVGTPLSVLGPLGNGFRTWPDKPLAALVGGGVGIPPMLYQAEALKAAGKGVVAFNGVRTARLLPLTLAGEKPDENGRAVNCVEEFTRLGIPAVVATDDGTCGVGGVVSESLRDWLELHTERLGDVVVYTCGPDPMMRAVSQLCLALGVECQLAMERKMACGMGTCQSCVIKIRDDSDRGWSYKLCCSDGPVFDAAQVIW
jgi:dihydroorotate dehydrogenase electron transfer subunit